jgi:hypothetical protein
MPSLWPIYLDKKMTTSSKAYGIELCCYWELGEEPFVSLMGTHWEQKKNKKSHLAPAHPTPPHPTHQRKNLGPRGCMLHHLIGLFQFLFLNSREQDIEASIEKRLFA